MHPAVRLVVESMAAQSLVVTNSLGQQIHPTEEGVENFWEWFGDSKIVDEQGRPLVAFHGTNADFEEFSDQFGKRGALGAGHYFTLETDPDRKPGYGTRTMPVYLRVTNPADKSDVIAAINQAVDEFRAMVERRELDPDERWSKETEARKAKRITEIMQEAGFDGVMMKDDPDRDVVVFSSKQVKSAMRNSGSFSPGSSRITEQTMINESVQHVLKEMMIIEVYKDDYEPPTAADKAKVQKILDDKSMPETAEDGKSYVVHWADGRGVFAAKSKKAISDWLEREGAWAEIVSIKYGEPVHRGKKLKVQAKA